MKNFFYKTDFIYILLLSSSEISKNKYSRDQLFK
jgi:hypothetical protein